jgi:ribosome-associated protein
LAKIGKPKTSKGLAVLCAKIAQEKIAEKIVVMDLTKIESAPADYFVMCTCNSDVQVRALTDSLLEKCREFDMKKPAFEGLTVGYWVLVDFFDVVMHIMLKEARSFYQLEKLWGDAKFLAPDEDGKLKAVNRKDLKFD